MSVSKLNNLRIEFRDTSDDLLAEIFIDDKPIVDSRYVVDLDELEKSIDYYGKFFILTCESNEPEHIEISKGINIFKDEEDYVHWKFSEPVSEKSFVFNADEYRISVLNALESWKRLVTENEDKKKVSYQELHSYVKYADEPVEEEEIA